MSEPVSVARFEGGTWTIACIAHPGIVTTGLWLDDVLEEHVAAVRGAVGVSPAIRYRIDGEDISETADRVREVLTEVHDAYRDAHLRDIAARPERYALLEELAQHRVMPSEMATMLGVEVRVAERYAGGDAEARIARRLLTRLRSS